MPLHVPQASLDYDVRILHLAGHGDDLDGFHFAGFNDKTLEDLVSALCLMAANRKKHKQPPLELLFLNMYVFEVRMCPRKRFTPFFSTLTQMSFEGRG